MTQTVQTASATVSYQLDGHAHQQALVLVSGTGGDLHSNWDHLLSSFTDHRKVLRVDYSGAGKTQDGGESLQIETLAQQVMAAAEVEQLDQFDLVGYSLGSSVAIYIAAHYPEKVRSLVLLAGFAFGGHSRLAMQSQLWLDLIKSDPRHFAQTIVLTGFTPAFVNKMRAEDIELWVNAICTSNNWDGIARQIDLDRRLDVRHYLPNIHAPTLVIGCSNDFMVPKEHSQELAREIPQACYIELDSGHLAPFERPEEVARLINSFIQTHAA